MKYYFLKTDSFPSAIANPESVILIQDESSKAELEIEDLGFIGTLIVNTDDIEESLLHIEDWWNETTSGTIELELVTEDVSLLNRELKELLFSLKLGEWSLNDTFIAYPKGDEKCFENAKKVIRESELNAQ